MLEPTAYAKTIVVGARGADIRCIIAHSDTVDPTAFRNLEKQLVSGKSTYSSVFSIQGPVTVDTCRAEVGYPTSSR